ncbi:MAG: hypothetical protein B7Z60_01935 [Ferrovum sp. 37-45-19]|nr:MAG: hypothetical protein B7Z65_06325 [Ferrovum sp. 21-44-67]OYV94978.1 MAG: hypothetical protein B7Z60_01935 [Ferrovum sp. 37-45-19]OZB34223.1 MAG: hypothetical protein B7X47_01225 [Ferrovum sp. 34-44-207]
MYLPFFLFYMKNLISGLGLRQPHYLEFLSTQPQVDYIEVHSENFFSTDPLNLKYLQQIRKQYSISLHGVGLSIGSAIGIERAHLYELRTLADTIQPFILSDHLSYSRVSKTSNRIYDLHDLLPIGLNQESLKLISKHVNEVQQFLGRRLYLENISQYIFFNNEQFTDVEFVCQLIKSTGCGLLLDLNNLYVNYINLKTKNMIDAGYQWINILLDSLQSTSQIGEIHLAGCSTQVGLIVDDHAAPPSYEVWQWYEYLISQVRTFIPTTIEWDENIPELEVLVKLTDKIKSIQKNLLESSYV